MFNIASLSTKEQTVVHLRHPVTDELLYADEAKRNQFKLLYMVVVVLYIAMLSQLCKIVN